MIDRRPSHARRRTGLIATLAAALLVLTAGIAFATTVTIVSKKVTLPHDSTTHKTTAKCPLGTKAAGGGVRLKDDVNDYFQGSYPTTANRRLWVGEAWRASSQSTDSAFTVYATCVKGQLKVRSKTKSLPDDSVSHSATATCPAGTKVIGGGTQLGDSLDDYMTGTYPAGTTGWTGSAYRGVTGTASFTAWAVCLPAGRVSVKSQKYSLPDDGGTHVKTVTCPAGTSATGGGVKLGDPNNDVPQGSYPAGKTSWTGAATRGTTGSSTFTVFAVCVK